MRKLNNIAVFAVSIILSSMMSAQNGEGVSDDLGRIELTAYVSDQVEFLDQISRNDLQRKLALAVNRHGNGGSIDNARFIITPNVNVLSKNVQASSPPRVSVVLDVGIFVGDGITGTKFSSGSIQVKGVGANETKAYLNAFKQLKPENKEFGRIITMAKPKILEYYNTRCDFILNEAEVAAAQNNFNLALLNLTTVPEVSRECYDRASERVATYYKRKIDSECETYLNHAKNIWNGDQSYEGATRAATILSSIDPSASCYREAILFSEEIGNRIRQIDDRQWKFEMRQQELDAEVEKASLSNTKELLKEFYANQPQTVMYNVRGWW